MIICANPKAQYLARRDSIAAAIQNVLESGAYVLGPQVGEFEKAYAEFLGASTAIGVANGTDALMVALRALDIGQGDEVITTSMTAIATVAAIVAVGATPVLADIDPLYYTLAPDQVEAAITPKTKAIIPVHLYGQMADMDAFMDLAAKHQLALIEDCAQAAGASLDGRRAGSIGNVGCHSFYPTKNLGGIGDGGCVSSRDDTLSDKVHGLRQYGWDAQRRSHFPGINSRLDELQAAILNIKLPHLDEDNARRRGIAAKYQDGLQGLALECPQTRPGAEHVFHLYVITLEKRDALLAYLKERDIFAGIHYPVPAHHEPGYEPLVRIAAQGLSTTEQLAQNALSLPMYPELTDDEVTAVIDAVHGFFAA